MAKGGVSGAMNKFEEIRNKLISKWISIPYAILVVLVAGACYNLFAYFQMIGQMQGYGATTMTTIKYTVLIGYYLGLIPGLILRALNPAGSFVVAAVLSAVSFSGLGYITNNGDGSMVYWVLMMLCLFFGAMSGSIATIAAIVTTVKSFPRIPGILIIVIMIAYFKVSPYLEFSIRSGFFEDPDLMWWFISIGLISAVVFLIGIVAIREIDLGGTVEAIGMRYDKMGLLVYVAVEVVFLAGFYVAALIYENWFIGAILFIVTIFLNFFVVGAVAYFVYSEIRAAKLGAMGERDKRDNFLFGDMLGKPKYIALIFSAFLVIGICSTFSFNIFQIAFSYGQIDNADHLLDTFWAGDMFARFVGGLFAYFTIEWFNGYRVAFYAAASAAIGFGVCLLTEPLGVTFLFIADVLISFGVGLFWVLVPSIIMEDAGEKDFGLNWGLSLFASVMGMVVFGEFFDWIYEWQANGEKKCAGGNCVLIQFIVFGVLLLFTCGLVYYALSKDLEEAKKKKGGKNEPRKSSGKGDRGTSKDKRDKSADRSGRGKSKDKRPKSTDKSGRGKSKEKRSGSKKK